MAITPAQADNLVSKENAVVGECEAYIDKQLAEQYMPGVPCCITIGYRNDRILAELMRRYEAAGWSVGHRLETLDQRDGTQIILTFHSSVKRITAADAKKATDYYNK